MSRKATNAGGVPYGLKYGITVVVLLVITGGLVLGVLPSRYALVAELRESGISFPTESDAVAFPMPRNQPVVEPPRPAPVPEASDIEVLWRGLDSLFARGDYDGAVARMEAYLDGYPNDLGVRRERARALEAGGRTEEARRAFRDLVRRAGSEADRLALARLERDAGHVDAAERLYRDLLAERPDDSAVRYELARLYLWAGRYEEAERELRALVVAEPENTAIRLDLARALYWADRPGEARTVLAVLPPASAVAAEAAQLAAELDRVLAPPPAADSTPPTLVEQAREAAAAGNLGAARAFYDRAVNEAPDDATVARERIDFLQFRAEDLPATTAALEAYRDRFGLDDDGRYRLARLYTWTGRYDEARGELEMLVDARPGRADAWVLLGDVRRYQDDREAARAAYAEALALRPGDERATAGMAELDRLRDLTIARRDPVPFGVGPAISWFRDSDEFKRLDAGGYVGWQRGFWTLGARGGFRRLEGFTPAGDLGQDEGGFMEVEVARWWSDASLRTAARAGVDHLDGAGSEPTGGVSVTRFGRSGSSIGASVEHAPAYPHTYTLESAAAGVTADRIAVTGDAPLGAAWGVAAEAEMLRLGAEAGASTRLSAAGTVTRRLSDVVSLDIGSRILGFTDPAPVATRRLYWDPVLFWSNSVGVAARYRPPMGLGGHLRFAGGAALADERDTPGREWIPQLSADGGLDWMSETVEVALDAFYRRSREDGYDAFGTSLTVRIRP